MWWNALQFSLALALRGDFDLRGEGCEVRIFIATGQRPSILLLEIMIVSLGVRKHSPTFSILQK